MVVLEKGGTARWVDLDSGRSEAWLSLPVVTVSEQGLLGLAFHPEFQSNGRFFLNYTAEESGSDHSFVAEWRVKPGVDLRRSAPTAHRVLMQVSQPYHNHNGGQLAFGPDGHLYIGWGDGGYADDPKGNGQNPATLLGAMLRIDVDHSPDGAAYSAPADNPFVGDPRSRPEIWAIGLRNPWRYSFSPDGRLIVADVGQDTVEEITIVAAGENHGWNIREGRRCFSPSSGCQTEGLVAPIYEYERADGMSVTGGYVYTGARIPALEGLYVFGDFITGAMWAIPLPASTDPPPPMPEASALGRWPILISSFGQDEAGELYVAGFGKGVVYRLDAP